MSVDGNGDVLGDIEAVPLVIDGDELTGDGCAAGVAHHGEVFTVQAPMQGEGVLFFDAVKVGVGERHPFPIDVDLCSWDVEDHAVVIALRQTRRRPLRQCGGHCGHEVFQEEAGGVDEVQVLRLTVQTDIVGQRSGTNHIHQLIYIRHLRIHLETQVGHRQIGVVGMRGSVISILCDNGTI